MPRRRTLVLLLSFTALAACPTLPEPNPCMSEIPAGGCPLDGGGTCADATCAVIYACLDAKWVAQKTCPTVDAGTPDGGAGGGGSGGAGGAPCTPVIVSIKSTGIDCMPDLEAPDCPIEAAGQCVETACLTGCIDFFVCGSDGYWEAAASCNDDGTFTVM